MPAAESKAKATQGDFRDMMRRLSPSRKTWGLGRPADDAYGAFG